MSDDKNVVTPYRLRCPTDMQRCKRKGFSLVELLVVIAIIALLCALLLPVLSEAKARAQQAECISNLHQFGEGLQNFLANNHGYISYVATDHDDYPGVWAWQLQKFGFGLPIPNGYLTHGVWRCPAAQFRPLHNTSPDEMANYFYNLWGLGTETNWLGLGGYVRARNVVRTSESDVNVPGEMMAFGDNFNGDWSSKRFDLDYLMKKGNTSTRHHGRANVVFCDGHVESPTLQYLFVDTNDEALCRWNRDHQPHRELLPP